MTGILAGVSQEYTQLSQLTFSTHIFLTILGTLKIFDQNIYSQTGSDLLLETSWSGVMSWQRLTVEVLEIFYYYQILGLSHWAGSVSWVQAGAAVQRMIS